MAVMESVRRTSRIELHSFLSIKPTHAVSLSLAKPSPGGKGWGTYHH